MEFKSKEIKDRALLVAEPVAVSETGQTSSFISWTSGLSPDPLAYPPGIIWRMGSAIAVCSRSESRM